MLKLMRGFNTKKYTNQKGFGTVEIILIIVVTASLVGLGVYVWRSRPKNTPLQTSGAAKPPQQKPVAAPETKKLASTESALLNYDLQYPSNWSAETKDSTQGDGGPKTRTDTLTSPTGTKLTISQDYGGYGGACQPDSKDQPFKAGNLCPTLEVVHLEPIKGTAYDKQGKQIPIMLTNIHYALPDGSANYNICLQASTDPGYPVEVSKPYMGFVRSTPSISVYGSDGTLGGGNGKTDHPLYLTACASSTSPDFFNSADGKAAQEILRTFSFK